MPPANILQASFEFISIVVLPTFPTIEDIPDAKPAKIFNAPIMAEVESVSLQLTLRLWKSESMRLVVTVPAMLPIKPPAKDVTVPSAKYPKLNLLKFRRSIFSLLNF